MDRVDTGDIRVDAFVALLRAGAKSEVKGDSVVLAAGLRPNRRLFDELVGIRA